MSRLSIHPRDTQGRRIGMLFLCCFAFCSFLDGAEIRSNGSGGGKWSQAATWGENRVPTTEDTVVIEGGDKVIFDRDDSAVVSCAALQLDPESRFELEGGAGKRVFRVAGLFESYGSVRMDGTLSPEDHLEIQLVAADEGKLALHKGGSLIISGYPNLPEGRKNAMIHRPAGEQRPQGHLTADTGCAIDVKNALFENTSAVFTSINNTGIRPNERLNLVDCRFVNANVTFTDCDTPQFARNELAGSEEIKEGLLITRTPMAEIKGNKIAGYPTGIRVVQSEITLDSNMIENATHGISTSSGKVTIRGGTIRNAKTGILYNSTGGSIQDGSIEKSQTAIRILNSNTQITNMTFGLPEGEKDPVMLEMNQGSVMVVNSNLDPKFVRVKKGNATPAAPPVIAMQYLVAKVTGKTPPDAYVLVETKGRAKGAAGAADPNIRNSPAPVLANGLTPLPRSMSAIIVKSWEMKWDGRLDPSPEYRLAVIVPSPGGEGAPKEYKSIQVKPDGKWLRPDLDSQEATLEISL